MRYILSLGTIVVFSHKMKQNIILNNYIPHYIHISIFSLLPFTFRE